MAVKVNQNINKVLKYIDEHLEETFTSQELAKVAGYSEYHFCRMFKSYMSMTIKDYVNKRRLIKGSEDILGGEKIIDVAMKYGWQSHSGFTKAFRKEFGFYPSLLRVVTISIESLGGSAMSHVFLEKVEVGATKEELFARLQEKIKENKIDVEMSRLNIVYHTACNAYDGVNRYSGEEYVTHVLNVAILLAELGTEAEVVLAGLFCDVTKKGIMSFKTLEKELPKEVFDIVLKVQNTGDELETASEDVVLIKLAERLHNMRTIEFMDESKKREKANETIQYFIPVAVRLKNKKLLDELNDLSMKYYVD